MSDERFSGHPSPAQQETANRGEIVAIEDLPVRLGFSETEELGQVRSQLVEAMVSNNTEAVKKLATRYHLLAEQVVNHLQA